MGLITKETDVGTLYINDKSFKMAINHNGQIITNQTEVYNLLEDKRIPIKAQFEITEKCNFNCYYCYAKSLRGQKDLTTKEVIEVIDILYENGVVFLEITGGEALAREDFLEILKYINKKKFIVALYTNAYNLNNEIVEELKRGITSIVNLSLLAPIDEICDRLTGIKGSFKKTISAIKELKESGIKFRITSTITNENINLYTEYQQLNNELNIDISFAIDVAPTFEGYSNVSRYAIKNADLSMMKLFLQKDIKKLKNLASNFRCSGGKSKFAIDNQGNMLPCIKYRESIGNILKVDFNYLWNSVQLIDIIINKFKRSSDCECCKKKDFCLYCPGIILLHNEGREKCRQAEILYEASTNI